ncbi:MAG: PQQ-dependent sugar dehydrogenase [Polyangiaceae bacterium]|nr:PQQ-dependent sugar dehydrogenase [Polyangiaceae bacterium]
MLLVLGACTVTAPNGKTNAALGNPVVGDPPRNVDDVFIVQPGDFHVQTWIQNLEIPWSLAFLPDGRALVSERPGRIRLIKNDRLVEQPYVKIDVASVGEGGLMGLAVHPRFPEEPYVYAMHTVRVGGELFNRVIRLRDHGTTAAMDKVIIDRIPGYRVHDGGRIAFGPDGMLYVTTGDTWEAEIAQDLDSLGGKILRVAPDGSIPQDNPFEGSPIYSYGHRNPQGLAWHPRTNHLFSSEHGPSGEFGLRGHDSIDVIQKGGNYGWPLVLGDVDMAPYVDPIIMWKQATPPAGMAFLNEDLYIATLRSEALVRVELAQRGGSYEVTAIERLFARDWDDGVYGRLRDVVRGPDGSLYVLTSNRDGRGTPRPGDDKILRLTPRGR